MGFDCSPLIELTLYRPVSRDDDAWVAMRENKMNNSDWIRFCARSALVFTLLIGYAQAQGTSPVPAGKQPNIVLVLMDNLGWGEPGVYGGGILRGAPTPRIDQLAAE